MATCFISYSRTPMDQAAIARVRWLLDRGRISYWFDGQLSAREGTGLNAEIAAEIDRAQVVIAITSSQSVASNYCRAEVARSLSLDKPLIRLDIEPVRLPGELLPLGSARTVSWYDAAESQIDGRLLAALAEKGVAAQLSAQDFDRLGYDSIDDPMAALVRPSFEELRRGSAAKLNELARRITAGIAINPSNGFNHLSLALIQIAMGDAVRARASAETALSLMPLSSMAHHAEALGRCALIPPSLRSLGDVEMILRRLARARRLASAGAHTDLLSALVIANYYLPRHLTPPAGPNELLRQGMSRNFVFDEINRVFSVEPIEAPEYLDPAILARYAGLG